MWKQHFELIVFLLAEKKGKKKVPNLFVFPFLFSRMEASSDQIKL